jgi:pantoate--beta-alanine ligase
VTGLLRQVSELRPLVAGWKRAGEAVAVVPTMGALHEGHVQLVERARSEADRVIVTIFVNPRQFNRDEDLARYPRDEAADVERLAPHGVDVVFAPLPDEVYPAGHATTVTVRGVSEDLEGAYRPGHFDGVATVVAKLFGMTQADLACFGEKDWQQLQVVRRLVADLDLPVRIVGCPTARESDGLALSSRNLLLAPEARARAVGLPRALEAAAAAITAGGDAGAALDSARAALLAAGFDSVDYVELRDAASLAEVTPDRSARLLAAAWIGGVRLIDNLAVDGRPPSGVDAGSAAAGRELSVGEGWPTEVSTGRLQIRSEGSPPR